MTMQAGKWILAISEIEGFHLMAPLSFWTASTEEIEKKTGGCGPGSIGDWFVPDSMYLESVYLACQIHDWCYGEGETPEDKAIADRIFLWNMTVLIQDTPYQPGQKEKDALDIVRLRRVMSYYEAVSYGGSDAFDKGETMKGDTT
jgi:hypothetical protein